MGIFRRRSRPDHSPGVIYVFDKRPGRLVPYYCAVCTCGWYAETVDVSQYPDLDVEKHMAALAVAHSPNADVNVGFPLDRPRSGA